jgi:hypothetical protein
MRAEIPLTLSISEPPPISLFGKPLYGCEQNFRGHGGGYTVIEQRIIEKTFSLKNHEDCGMRPSPANQPAGSLSLERGDRVVNDRNLQGFLRWHSPQFPIISRDGEMEASSIQQRIVDHAATIHRADKQDMDCHSHPGMCPAYSADGSFIGKSSNVAELGHAASTRLKSHSRR